jgi:hypothetical protein
VEKVAASEPYPVRAFGNPFDKAFFAREGGERRPTVGGEATPNAYVEFGFEHMFARSESSSNGRDEQGPVEQILATSYDARSASIEVQSSSSET